MTASERDCEHGQLARSCDRCADAREIADLRQQLDDEKRQHDITRGELARTRLVRDELLHADTELLRAALHTLVWETGSEGLFAAKTAEVLKALRTRLGA